MDLKAKMDDLVNATLLEFEELDRHNAKYGERKVLAAGVRARKSSRRITHLMKEFREVSKEFDKTIKE